MGRSETDLDAQLNFMWHELTTSDSGALNALRWVRTPADATHAVRATRLSTAAAGSKLRADFAHS